MDLQDVEFLESANSFRLVSKLCLYHSISYHYIALMTWKFSSLPYQRTFSIFSVSAVFSVMSQDP